MYKALKAMEELETINLNKYFRDNGFVFDEDSKHTMLSLRTSIIGWIKDNIDGYIANQFCKDVEHMVTFRNHNNKIQKLLEDRGFLEYARRVETQKDKELSNIAEIKSRQELRSDYSKFLNDSKMDRFTPYTAIKDYVKTGRELQNRVAKYKFALGKDGSLIQENLDARVIELEKAQKRIEQDIIDIWDDLPMVKTSENIKDLINRINMVLQKGILAKEKDYLEEIKGNLEELLADVQSLYATDNSRVEFKRISESLKEKYVDSEFDFDVNEVLNELIKNVSEKLDVKEKDWIQKNLSLGDKSRDSVHVWKERIKYLPEYLSDKTKEDVKKIDAEADEIIKDGKIEDVVYYFDKLDINEKKECLKKLQDLLK